MSIKAQDATNVNVLYNNVDKMDSLYTARFSLHINIG